MFGLVELAAGPAAVAGDNLGVVRYCADIGRFCSIEAHGILDHVLERTACRFRPLRWFAVRWRFNAVVDEAAIEGCQEAVRSAARGHW
eukprot:10762699-Lingulodinium_polyedra.AAC.1